MYEELYSENRGLLHNVARHWSAACKYDRAVSVEDLEQAGFFGLIRASQSYDPDKGTSWPTWAARYISKEMCLALGYRWRPAAEDEPAGYKPTKAYTGAYSLDTPLLTDNPDGMTWADTLTDESLSDADEGVNLEALQRYVREAVERLQNHQQRTVITLCDLQGKPYRVAAKVLGVSVERIRKIRVAAMKNMKNDDMLVKNAETDIELRTPYYEHVTVKKFQTTHTSATEKAALWRLDQERKLLDTRGRTDWE